MLGSLRTKLGSALELLRLYQHKLQVLDSMPVGTTSQASQPAPMYSRCSDCTHVSPGPTSAGVSRDSQYEEAAATPTYETATSPWQVAPERLEPSPHSLLAQGTTSAWEALRQLDFRFDPSIGQSGAFLCTPKPAPAAQPVGIACRKCPVHSTNEVITVRGHTEQFGKESCDVQTRTSTSEEGDCSGGCHEELAGDPWAFMRMSQCEGHVHAVKRFQGDLLSLVSDIDEMMSCSGKAPAEASDTVVSDSSTTHRSYK